MAKLTKQEEYVAKMYFSYFGKAADADTIKAYGLKENGKPEKASVILRNIIDDSDYEKIGLSTEEFVNNAFQNLFGRNASTKEMNKYSKVVEKGNDLPINSIVKSATKFDKAVNNNKLEVAAKYAELGGKGDLDLSKISKGNLITDIKTVGSLSDLTNAIEKLADNSVIPSSFDGKTFVLTASADTGKDFIGTAKNDLFVASDSPFGATSTWSAFDSIDGGKGTDGLKIVSTKAAVNTTDFENNTMKSIEEVYINAGTNNIDLDTTQAGKVAENFKAVTDLELTTTTGTIDVIGGKNIVAKAGAAIAIGEDTDATTAATIEKITIDGLGAASTIGSGTAPKGSVDALKELTVKNSTAGTLGVTTAVETLKVNFDNSNSAAALTLTDTKLKTLNVDASGKKSNVDFDTTSTILETLNISGNAKLTLEGTGALESTVITTSKVKEINVTNTKGVVIEDTLNIDTKFTGGTGADSVVLGATTKAIAMGAGDDIVKYGGELGTGGSVDAGAGIKDTIKMTADDAHTISGKVDNKFDTTFSNFEVLEIDTTATPASAVIIDTRKINNVSQVTVGVDLVTSSTINNLVNGGTVKFTADQATTVAQNLTVNIFEPHKSTTNVLNLELSDATTINARKVTADGVETININSDDTNATAGTFAHTLTLTAKDATSVVVTGDAGINITPTGSVKVTNFDASAVTAGAVTFTSTNETAGQAVTIKGGAGADILEGHAKANDTIIGGKGNDTITYTGGKDSFTGGEGIDTFVIGAGALGTTVDSVYLTIQDLTKGDIINVAAIAATTAAAAGAASTLGAKVTVGSGATFSQALDAAASTPGASFAATGTSVLKWFQFESNTYLVVDNTAATTTYVNGADSVIKITGLVDLTNSSYNLGDDIITIA